MSKSQELSASPCFTTYHKTHENVLKLKSYLPEKAVDGIVQEVLSRVKSQQLVNSDSINTPSATRVNRLAYALIGDDPEESMTFIDDVRAEGATLDAVYLMYLQEAARVLGEWWEEDHVSFVEVMVGTSRIYSIVRSLSYLFVPDRPVEVKSAVFASVPGETHMLGVRMASDLLGQSGWNIDLKVGLPHDDLVREIQRSESNIIGLSAGGEHAGVALARLVMALRLSNPAAAIFVSGQITQEAQHLLEVMDIDGIVESVEEAEVLMEHLWREKSQRESA